MYQVDEVLIAIDSLNPEELHNQGIQNPSSNFIGGFGVFDLNEATFAHIAEYSRELAPTDHATPPYETIQQSPPLVDQQNFEFSRISVTEAIDNETASVTSQAIDLVPCLRPFMQIAQVAHAEDEASSQEIEQLDLFGSREDYLHPPQQLDLSNAAFSPIIPQHLQPRYLSPNENLLLQYYTTRVVHIFPTLDAPKSPWATFHLPRVLHSVGELSVRGATSEVRAALRSTLLSISAFFLSKHMRSQSRNDESKKWRTEAIHFHGRAMNILKDVVNTKFTSQERPKYKELLATIMSMVSINVSLYLVHLLLFPAHM